MDNFVEVYKNWVNLCHEADRMELTAKQRILMNNLLKAKKDLWNLMPEPRRQEIIDELILSGHLPAEVSKAINIFDASLVEL